MGRNFRPGRPKDHDPLTGEQLLALARKLENWIRFDNTPLPLAGYDLDVWIRRGTTRRGRRGHPWVKVWEMDMDSDAYGPVPEDGIELWIDSYGTTPRIRTLAAWKRMERGVKAALLAMYELEE